MILKIPRMEQISDQTEDVNWEPLSEVRRAGTPKLKTHIEMKALAQASAVMEERGTASCHREVLSITSRRARVPLDPDGIEKIFCQEQGSSGRKISSLSRLSHTNLEDKSLREACAPGWERS